MIQHPHHVEAVGGAVLAGIPPDTQDNGDGAAVAGQATLPGHEDFPESGPTAEVVIRLIEDAVSQPGAHDGADQEHIQQGVQQGGVYLFPYEETLHDVPAQDEAAHEQQRIPPEFEPADMQNDGINIPMNYQKIYHSKDKDSKILQICFFCTGVIFVVNLQLLS